MFTEATKKCAANARVKADLLASSFGRYFALSVLAGFFIGIAVAMVYTIGAPLDSTGFPATRLIMGITFPVGLTLIIYAGAELFTGNVMFTTVGLINKSINLNEMVKILCVSYIGNLTGALFLAFLVYSTGNFNEQINNFILTAAVNKSNLGVSEILANGVLCNIMVCLALWSALRAKEEVMKFIIILFCLTAFITSGYIHSVADMTHLTLALLAPGGDALGFSGYFYVLLLATAGNLIGGLMVGGVYAYVGQENK